MEEFSDYIKDLYAKLESKTDLKGLDYGLLHDASLSENDRIILQKELWILSDIAIMKDCINYKYDIIEYGIYRIGVTSNIYLLSRYNHVLFNLTKNTLFCKNAINNYIQIFRQYIEEKQEGYKIHLILDWIIKLSTKIRFDLTLTENLVLSILNSNSIDDNIKRWILVTIKDNYSKWKPKRLEFVPQMCLSIYSREHEYGKCKQILEVGEFFAERLDKSLLPSIYESLGDNEEKAVLDYKELSDNIVKPHYNQYTYQRMMQYYKKAGNAEKLRLATSKYNNNKVGMKFMKFEEKIELPTEIKEILTATFEWAKGVDAKTLLQFLSTHNNLFMSHSTIDNLWKKIEDSNLFHIKHMNAVRCDINNNIRSVSHEELYKFHIFDIYMQNSVRWIIHILSSAISSKKISFPILKRILLRQSEFGNNWIIKRNEQQYSFCWFDKIDFALKDFVDQYKKELNGKTSDWRNVINTFTMQFEGILRDIIRIYNGETSKIVGSKKENVAEMLLDDLLRTEACQKLFSDEDKDLFYYTFTSKGYNIRNDVAHGFYLPQDYTTYKAILVFLCMLRLIRYN